MRLRELKVVSPHHTHQVQPLRNRMNKYGRRKIQRIPIWMRCHSQGEVMLNVAWLTLCHVSILMHLSDAVFRLGAFKMQVKL